MINPLSPELKQQIDTIRNNPNLTEEQKQEAFGLWFSNKRTELGGPPLKPMNMQSDVNINDINNAKYTGSQRMNFESDQQFEKDFPTDDLPNYTQTSRESMTPPQQPPMQQPQPMKQQPGMLSGVGDWMGEQKDKLGEYLYAGKDQQGMFGPTGVNPKNGQDRGSMGLGGAFGRIFNDPARMAMLAGGLTAMDPNSYYDKEGFSSPWSGLKAGLGGAQAGYKSVIDRRKAEAETASLAAIGNNGKYQTFEEPTRDGKGVEKVTYFVKPNGDRQEIKRSPILKTAFGVGAQGKPAGGTFNISSGTFIPSYEKAVNTGKYNEKDIDELNKDYDFDQVILSDVNAAISLVNEKNMGGSGLWDRAVDSGSAALPGVAKFLGLDPSKTSEATELVRLFDNIKSTNFKVAMGVALQGKLIDSSGDRKFIEEVLRSPKDFLTHHADLKKNLERLSKIMNKLQRKREGTGHIGKSKKSSGTPSNFEEKYKHLFGE
jgi:hypothetical protein